MQRSTSRTRRNYRCPKGPLIERGNYFGLLSFTVVQTLQLRGNPLTYRELARIIGGRYRASRGTRTPTPFAEGDIDREVLGESVWPRRSEIVLERAKGKLQLSVGELHGITPGSVLAVYPPAGDTGDTKSVVGYVKVDSATPTAARVTPCAFAGRAAVAPDALKDQSRCEVVERHFGQAAGQASHQRSAGPQGLRAGPPRDPRHGAAD